MVLGVVELLFPDMLVKVVLAMVEDLIMLAATVVVLVEDPNARRLVSVMVAAIEDAAATGAVNVVLVVGDPTSNVAVVVEVEGSVTTRLLDVVEPVLVRVGVDVMMVAVEDVIARVAMDTFVAELIVGLVVDGTGAEVKDMGVSLAAGVMERAAAEVVDVVLVEVDDPLVITLVDVVLVVVEDPLVSLAAVTVVIAELPIPKLTAGVVDVVEHLVASVVLDAKVGVVWDSI